MASGKKPWYATLFNCILTLICLIVLIVGGVFLFFKIKYNVNVFTTIAQVKVLNEKVDVAEKFKNQFSETDMDSAMTIVNAQVAGLIVKTATGYEISTSGLETTMENSFSLTGKQVGAIGNVMLTQTNQKTVNIGGKELTYDLLQVDFLNIEETKADVNIVIKVNIDPIKEDMTGFFMNIVKKNMPSDLYISSTVTIEKGATAFAYTVTSKSLTLNNLTEEQTANLLTTINKFMSFTTVEEINKLIGGSFADAMIGTETNKGFAYSLKTLGATDYNFVLDSETGYFTVLH